MKIYNNIISIKNIKSLAFLLAMVLISSTSYAGTGPGTTGLQFLKNDISPRAIAMGGAFTAVSDDVYAINYNPAGLAQIQYPEVSAMYLSGFEDSSLSNANFGMLLPMVGFARYARPAVGLSFISSSAGDFTHRVIQSNGSIQSTKLDAQQDLVVSLNYSEKFFVGDMVIEKLRLENIEQYAGINLKYIRSTLVEEYEADAFAADIGYLLKHIPSGISFGLSVSNFGGGLTYLSENTKMPTILRAGLSYKRPTLMDQTFRLAVDAASHINESIMDFHFGTEYAFDKYIILRGGYRAYKDNPGITLGIGLCYDDMSLDVGSTVGAEVYDTTQISFSYRFSGLAYKNKEVKKRKFVGPNEKVATPIGQKQEAPYKQRYKQDMEETDSQPQQKAKPATPANNGSDIFLLY